MPTVKFLNEKKTATCEVGANLRQVAIANDADVYSGSSKVLNCGGHGTCGTCMMYVKKGVENCSPMGPLERARLSVAWGTIGHEYEARLSCQTKVLGDLEVENVPEVLTEGTNDPGPYPWPPRSRKRTRPGAGHPTGIEIETAAVSTTPEARSAALKVEAEKAAAEKNLKIPMLPPMPIVWQDPAPTPGHGHAHDTAAETAAYLKVFGGLGILTVVTVAIATVDLGHAVNDILAVLVAGGKAAMVVAVFMHLRSEHRSIVALALLPIFLVLVLFLLNAQDALVHATR